MFELVHMYSAACAASVEHYSIEELAMSFGFSLIRILCAKQSRCIIWAVQQMQLNGHRPEAGNKNGEKDADRKQLQVSVTTNHPYCLSTNVRH